MYVTHECCIFLSSCVVYATFLYETLQYTSRYMRYHTNRNKTHLSNGCTNDKRHDWKPALVILCMVNLS